MGAQGADRNSADPSLATRLLQAAGAGAPGAAEELFPVVYAQLRTLAQSRMRGEMKHHTLQATALVHEAYMRLIGEGRTPSWPSRAHFFRAAAEAMRRILIEHARRRGRIKRGGELKRAPIDVLDLASDDSPEQILALDAAIAQLEARDARAAEIVRLRFYAGLSVEDVASALKLSDRTVKREWSFARAWLFQELSQ